MLCLSYILKGVRPLAVNVVVVSVVFPQDLLEKGLSANNFAMLGLGDIVIPVIPWHAQPALLYLVPACLGTPILLAIFKGDLKAMLK